MPITNSSLTNRFSEMVETVAASFKQLSAVGLFMRAMERVLFALFTCILALGEYAAFSFLLLCYYLVKSLQMLYEKCLMFVQEGQ